MEIKDLGKRNLIAVPDNLQGSIRISVKGDDNKIIIGAGCRFPNLIIDIRNNNSEVLIGDHCAIMGDFTCVASNTRILIGNKTSMQGVKIIMHEINTVSIGTDCMFAGNIRIIPSDMHSIMDISTGKRVNPPGDITIHDHVWIGYDVQVMKNVTIGENSVIGTGAIVTRNIPKNCIAGGIPARVLRSGVTWDRKLIPVQL